MKLKILSVLAFLFALNSYAHKFPEKFSDTTKTADTLKVGDTTRTADSLEVEETKKTEDSLSKEEKKVLKLIKKKTTPEEEQDTVEVDTIIVYWSKKNAVGINFNEVAFVNWNAGGNNSISALFHGTIERNYKKDHLSWKNRTNLRYGLNAQEGREIRKSDDEFRLNSSFGYRRNSESNWYYSAKLDFNTQIAHGYRYPNTDSPISKFMAPGYLFLGVGSEYSGAENGLDLYISPLTQKSTFVLDQRLANEGMFGVQAAEYDEEGNIIRGGEKVRTEIGVLFTGNYEKEVFQNVNLKTRLNLYSDYLNKFGNIDVDWQMDVNMRVNDFIKASIGTHLRYDDDVKHKMDVDGDGDLETVGPRVQFKQMLGVGVVYEF